MTYNLRLISNDCEIELTFSFDAPAFIDIMLKIRTRQYRIKYCRPLKTIQYAYWPEINDVMQ